MSRIGRMPISIPAGVDVKIEAGNLVTVKGPKGTLTQQLHPAMTITQEGDVIHVTRPNDEKANRSLHGPCTAQADASLSLRRRTGRPSAYRCR